MKVKNETNYDTRYLRSLFIQCEKYIFRTCLVHGERKDRNVTVKYKKGVRVAGYAWYRSNSIVMRLPRPESTRYGIKNENHVNARSIARVYLHEVGHNIGLRHEKMGSIMNIDVSWCPDELIVQKEKKMMRAKKNVVEVRAEKAEKKLAEWTKKMDRAKTFVKKYQKKVKYYEKKMAASVVVLVVILVGGCHSDNRVRIGRERIDVSGVENREELRLSVMRDLYKAVALKKAEEFYSIERGE